MRRSGDAVNKADARPSKTDVRILLQSLLAVSLWSASAEATAVVRLHPPWPIDAARFDALLAAVQAESFADGKLGQLRVVAGTKAYSFGGGQAVALLAAFDFWVERVEALRLLPLADQAGAKAVLRYFSGAPSTLQSEAQQILAVDH